MPRPLPLLPQLLALLLPVLLLLLLQQPRPAAPTPTSHLVTCFNSTHYMLHGRLHGCPPHTPRCRPHITRREHLVNLQQPPDTPTGFCSADDIGTHLRHAVGFQIVEQVPAGEAAECAADPLEDARAGRMLCEVLHGTAALQPTFAHELGNTWLSYPGGAGRFGNCSFSSAAGWRQCVAANIAQIAALAVARSPALVISSGLMEFLYQPNLDDPSTFSSCCVPGSIGQWGSNQTCVPDIRSPCAQDYYVTWGKLFLDAGSRAVFFGQSRLTGGGRPCDPDGSGCSRVSTAGAAGFAAVIARLKAYAATRGYGPIFFGPQAAAGFLLANNTEVADWVYGAQHLHSRGAWLVQPYGVNGSAPALGPQWYGSSDPHDANRINNNNNLPVLLDFDNFSGDEQRPDDIRRLSAWPNATRPAFVRSLWWMLRLYNPRATLAIPLSKAAGGNWPAFRQPQSQCFSRGQDGLYFGAYSCNIVGAVAINTTSPVLAPANLSDVLSNVNLQHLGAALQSPDLTAVFAFRALLDRDFGGWIEYQDAVKALPGLVLGARGARAASAATILASPEFQASPCARDPACVQTRLRLFLCLGRTDICPPTSAEETTAGMIAAFSDAADSVGLFGNAALMDPAWCLGC